jgi:hypothetical protein
MDPDFKLVNIDEEPIQTLVERRCCRPKLAATRWDSSLRRAYKGTLLP